MTRQLETPILQGLSGLAAHPSALDYTEAVGEWTLRVSTLSIDLSLGNTFCLRIFRVRSRLVDSSGIKRQVDGLEAGFANGGGHPTYGARVVRKTEAQVTTARATRLVAYAPSVGEGEEVLVF